MWLYLFAVHDIDANPNAQLKKDLVKTSDYRAQVLHDRSSLSMLGSVLWQFHWMIIQYRDYSLGVLNFATLIRCRTVPYFHVLTHAKAACHFQKSQSLGCPSTVFMIVFTLGSAVSWLLPSQRSLLWGNWQWRFFSRGGVVRFVIFAIISVCKTLAW